MNIIPTITDPIIQNVVSTLIGTSILVSARYVYVNLNKVKKIEKIEEEIKEVHINLKEGFDNINKRMDSMIYHFDNKIYDQISIHERRENDQLKEIKKNLDRIQVPLDKLVHRHRYS